MLISFGASDIGRRRQLNEDALLIDEKLGLFIVADGMGGHNAGEVASRLAVEAVAKFVRRSGRDQEGTWPEELDPALSFNANRLRAAIRLANRSVWGEADNRQEYTGMGTTIVAALIEGDTITYASAGDSRAYRIRDGQLLQMTVDDSWVQSAVDEGLIDPAEAESHPMRNIITKAIGAKEEIDTEVKEESLRTGDTYLLCTDGLHGLVSEDRILRTVLEAQDDLERAVHDLIAAANEEGGRDNITLLLVRYVA